MHFAPHCATAELAPSGRESGPLLSRAQQPLLVAHAIVTPGAIAKGGDFDILIRADAGVDLPALDDIHLMGGYQADDGLLAVDFDDRHHPLARKWTRSRKAAYEAAGWEVLGGPAVDRHDRLYNPARVGQPVLPYQSPTRRRMVTGKYRTAEYAYQKRRAPGQVRQCP